MNEKGVWRTIRGRRVFIKDGEDLESAMKRSGKFGTKFSPEEMENLRKAGREARAREIDKNNLKEDKIKIDWKKQIEINNANMEKDVADMQNKINEYRNKSYQTDNAIERYQYWQEAERLQKDYYERFRENERANAKIKREEPNEKYMNIEAYAGYKDKFNQTWGEDGSGTKVVSAKMYTNDEFMEHLEDANWHGERKQLLEANLTNKELSYIKDRTKVSAWGVENLTGKKQVEEVIKEAKSRNPSSISKMSLTELRIMANDYGIDTKGKSKKQLLSALISMFNK